MENPLRERQSRLLFCLGGKHFNQRLKIEIEPKTESNEFPLLVYKESLAPITSSDDHDSFPNELKISKTAMLMKLFSIFNFVFDFSSDLAVAAVHFIKQEFWNFLFTLLWVLIPSFIITYLSIRWYMIDSKESCTKKLSKKEKTIRIIFLILQLAPVMRWIDSLRYGWKFRQIDKNNPNQRTLARTCYQHYIYEHTDATMLTMIEGFLEAAPQLVIQLSILLNDADKFEKSSNKFLILFK